MCCITIRGGSQGGNTKRLGTGKGGRKLSGDAQRLQRRRQVWDLYCKGSNQVTIAKTLGINQSTVSRDLAWMTAQIYEELVDDIWRVKIEQYARLDYIISEALGAWRASKEEAIEVSRKITLAQPGPPVPGAVPVQGVAGSAQRLEQTTKVRRCVGDPRFLQMAREAMAEQRKILGADAPLKVAQTDPSGTKSAPGVVVILPYNGREPLPGDGSEEDKNANDQ